MKQQTAVKWLIKEIKNFDSGRSKYYNKTAIYEYSYRMEKEQIIDAYKGGVNLLAGDVESASECYYNKTYER